jgi:hypothetical protein
MTNPVDAGTAGTCHYRTPSRRTSAHAVAQVPASPDLSGYSFRCRKPYLATTQVPRNANTVTKMAVGMVEWLPSTLLKFASGPQIAVMNTATHMAVIASDAHISGMSGSDDHRGRSLATREGSCDMVDIFYTLLLKSLVLT